MGRFHGKQRTTRGSRHSSSLLGFEPLENRQLLAADLLDLSQLNDEFDDASTIDNWQRIHEVEGWNADDLQTWDIGESNPGRMTLVPHTTTWFEDYRGPLVFKEILGNFQVTTQVHITDRDAVGDSDADAIPDDSTFSLGGVMIRAPRAINDPSVDWAPGSHDPEGPVSGENFVFLSLGHANSGGMTLEVKNTRNSRSELTLLPLDTQVAELRLTRVGDDVTATYRLPGGDWQLAGLFGRHDLPETLQVGLVSYTDYEKVDDFDPFYHNSQVLSDATVPAGLNPSPQQPFNPDIEASFEYLRFERLYAGPVEIVGDTVVIAGDELENEVEIQDLGGGSVTVSFLSPAQGEPLYFEFAGVERINVELAAGDDVFRYEAGDSLDLISEMGVRLGSGEDSATVDLFFDALADDNPVLTHTFEGGAGNDQLHWSGDFGNNQINLDLDSDVEEVNLTLSNLRLGAEDVIGVNASRAQVFNRILNATDIEGEYSETIEGTASADQWRLSTNQLWVRSTGEVSGIFRTMDGSDHVVDRFYDTRNEGGLFLDYQLGSGDDVYHSWVQTIHHAGQMDTQVSGDDGNDRIFSYTRAARVDSLSTVSVNLSGGDGNDFLRTVARRSLVNGSLSLSASGGDGDDAIWSYFRARRGSLGTIAAQVHGNEGADRLRLRAFVPATIDELFAEVDGGSGQDTCWLHDHLSEGDCEV